MGFIKIYYDIKILADKVLFLRKQEVKFVAVVENLINKKELDVLEQVQIVHLYGKVVVLFLVQNQKKVLLKLNKKERKLALQTLLYNKRNNISIIDNLELGVDLPKTKTFYNVCKNCKINLDQKILVITSEKTIPLKLATRNIKNVELIAASNLNTFSLLKAKQILLTPLAVNDIKEIYCG